LTYRSVIIGLLGVTFVCSYTYFNDWIMRQTMFVGNFMPISIYGFLVLFLAFIYPILSRLHRGLAFKPAELAVILGMVLAACAIPGSNLLRLLTPSLVMPHRFEKTEPGWQKQGVKDLLPEGMLADISKDEETVLSGFTRGLGGRLFGVVGRAAREELFLAARRDHVLDAHVNALLDDAVADLV